jgi:hypothetical protein
VCLAGGDYDAGRAPIATSRCRPIDPTCGVSGVLSGVSESALAPDLGPGQRRNLGRRAQLLAATSVTYNLIEAVVAIAAGAVGGMRRVISCCSDGLRMSRHP